MATIKPLVHNESSKTAEELAGEAEDYFARHPALQFLAAFLEHARQQKIWSAQEEFNVITVNERMLCLAQRPDLRGNITHHSTGLFLPIAQAMKFEDQVMLINAAAAIEPERLLELFTPKISATYCDLHPLWSLFKDQKMELLLKTDLDAVKKIFAMFLEQSMAKNLLSHWDMRMALRHAWHLYIPIEMREKVDLLRLMHEHKNPRLPFTAKMEMEIITPDIILSELPLTEFFPVIEAIESALDYKKEIAPPIEEILGDLEIASFPPQAPIKEPSVPKNPKA